MPDNKKKIKKRVTLNKHVKDHEGLNIHQLERELISQLIDYSHENTTLSSFCSGVLMLLERHPSFKDKSAVIWRYDTNLISIIALNNINSDEQQELLKITKRTQKQQPLKISYVPLKHHSTEKIIIRIDISLEKIHSNIFYFSFWSEASESELKLLTTFFKDFFGIFNLCLLNILNEKQVKCLRTILEKAVDSDISTQKSAQDVIKKLTSALEQSPVLVLITDKTGTIEYVNAKVLEQTGYSSEEILEQNTRILQSGQTPSETYKMMWKQLTLGHEWRGELLNKNKKGDLFWVSAIISPLRNDEEQITHYLAVMEDISLKKSYEYMLKHQATYDNLTNLPNRSYGYNKLEHAIAIAHASKKKLAVLFLDLDEFKQINDSLGHNAGDSLLKALSERYLSVIRQTDTIARLGGDEFMMLLENLTHVSDAELIAKKCQEVCLQPFMIESQKLRVTSSIGIALYPEHGKDAKTLMRNADTAMYYSKMHNKNKWTVFNRSMAEVASSRILIKAELHQVLNRDELYLCYQPIIDIKTNTVVAAEALLRWHSASLGEVLADQIIPIAEETGLIVQLGYWILKKVCLQVKEWQSVVDIKIRVAVNISTIQLKQKDFVSKVKLILKKENIAPESLIFEVTESAFIDDSKFILAQLNELNEMNIHCSLDDFGMGYSSLNSLRSYPFKSLKIDRAFIQGINTNSNDLSLVNSIITMSRNLKLSVVAEGIETAEQLELMRSMNCDMVQGWYFSAALSSEQFLHYLMKQSIK